MAISKPGKEKQHPAPGAYEGPAGIYVHVPFCQTKCPYCAFVSYADRDANFKKNYILALSLQTEAMSRHPWARARKFHSLYIGGGTPSSVDTEALANFITRCLEGFDFSGLFPGPPEVTMEVNPNTVNKGMLKKLRQAGVNRLSIGVQSFSDTMLKVIGRKHSARQALQAAEEARSAGFTNISLDLMYGLPGQDISNWKSTLETAAAVAPEHLSVYELTVEPDTVFAELARQGKLALPGEDTALSMFEYAGEYLAACGYEHYEISNYGRPGFRCVHNINYWENGSYLGLGSGAVSCFSGLRIQSIENPERYISLVKMQQAPFREGEFLSLYDRFRESVIMGLRMTDGVSVSLLEKQYGFSPEKYYGKTLQALLGQGLLEEKQRRLRLTKKGMVLANRIMAQLV